jgi:hypothetical protein
VETPWDGSMLSITTTPERFTVTHNLGEHFPQSQKYSVSAPSFFLLAEEIAKIFPLRK